MNTINKLLTALFLATLIALGAGCGQKGDLYLPDQEKQKEETS